MTNQTKNTAQELDKAFKIGVLDRIENMDRLPALSSDLMEMMKTFQIGDGRGPELMKAWLKGWYCEAEKQLKYNWIKTKVVEFGKEKGHLVDQQEDREIIYSRDDMIKFATDFARSNK